MELAAATTRAPAFLAICTSKPPTPPASGFDAHPLPRLRIDRPDQTRRRAAVGEQRDGLDRAAPVGHRDELGRVDGDPLGVSTRTASGGHDGCSDDARIDCFSTAITVPLTPLPGTTGNVGRIAGFGPCPARICVSTT